MTLRIKVCCMQSVEETRLAIRYGAAALGFVSAMPSGAGIVDEETIASITPHVPPPIATFLLTSSLDADHIIEQQRRCNCNTLQLVDAVPLSAYAKLRRALPGVRIVQVIHVTGEESLAEAQEVAAHADALLLDSGNPKLTVKELGGTGRTHNWAISRQIVATVPVPVFLAGGLNPGNAAAAVEAVRPFGLDVCSGLRIDGKLDESKLAAFMAAAFAADRQFSAIPAP